MLKLAAVREIKTTTPPAFISSQSSSSWSLSLYKTLTFFALLSIQQIIGEVQLQVLLLRQHSIDIQKEAYEQESHHYCCCCIVWVKIFRKGEVLVVLVVSGFDNGANSIFESNPHAYKEIDVTSNPEALKQMND